MIELVGANVRTVTVSQDNEKPGGPSADEWIKERWYAVYNGIMLSHETEILAIGDKMGGP